MHLRQKTIILCLLAFWNALSSAQTVLPCLGKEELALHKARDLGPNFQINRKLVEEVAGLSDLKLKSQFYNSICGGKSQLGASIKLLEAMIKHGEGIFELPATGNDRVMIVQNNLTRDFLGLRAQLVLDFMEMVQASAPSAHCLEEGFPKYGNILARLKSLQEYVDPETLDRELAIEINKMNFFRRYPKIVAKCRPTPSVKGKR